MEIPILLQEIEDEIHGAENDIIVTIWNDIFPSEKIEEHTLQEDDIKEEVKEIIIDEIADYELSTLLDLYKELTGKEVTVEEFFYGQW